MPTTTNEYVVGLLYPQSGPAGLFGPSCLTSARLAVDDVNARGGILGRQVRIEAIDASVAVAGAAGSVAGLVESDRIQAVVGWHRSDVRRAVARRLDRRVPYVYTALYEGGEHTEGLWLTGETPRQQVLPALRWLRDELAVRRWFVVGSEYLWPRRTAAACHNYARTLGVQICGEAYRAVGTEAYDDVLTMIEASGATGVIQLQLGQDAVHFNRQFAALGLAAGIVRFSPLMDESMLLASGPDATADLFVASGYFGSLVTDAAMDFGSRYFGAYGPDACPPSAMGESCMEGLLLLESLVNGAGSTAVDDLLSCARPTRYDGPRGSLALRSAHTDQPVYLAAAAGCDFDVLTTLPRG
ncbi:substrate-binding domain-containing protein [Pimelobacter simplex]|uniref:substrate-binding domain-containing protein n=1 Tax=Nocardioides simplex TaxID=2045 RepID=UPI0036721C90